MSVPKSKAIDNPPEPESPDESEIGSIPTARLMYYGDLSTITTRRGEFVPEPGSFEAIVDPHDHDVLSGRGHITNSHPGNIFFRKIVSKYKNKYVGAPRWEKPRFAWFVVDAVKSRDPPGRFLKPHPSTGQWYELGEKRSVEKARQALREGAPHIEKQLEMAINDDKNTVASILTTLAREKSVDDPSTKSRTQNQTTVNQVALLPSAALPRESNQAVQNPELPESFKRRKIFTATASQRPAIFSVVKSDSSLELCTTQPLSSGEIKSFPANSASVSPSSQLMIEKSSEEDATSITAAPAEQGCVSLVRKLVDQGYLSPQEKKLIFTDMIKCKSEGKISTIQIAYDLLCRSTTGDDDVDYIELGKSDFIQQCKVLATDMTE